MKWERKKRHTHTHIGNNTHKPLEKEEEGWIYKRMGFVEIG